MPRQPLPNQPALEAPDREGDHPSLAIYGALLSMSAILIGIGFSLQERPDWPGLLLNIAAGFIGSVVVLVFVDRRLRSSEVEALARLPATGGLRLRALVFPTHRVAYRYTKSLLKALEPRIAHTVRLPGIERLENEIQRGFVLTGEPGTGKTTWTQVCASDLGRRYLSGESEGRVTILFPLARWSPDRSLHRSLFEWVYNFAPCTEWAFDRLLKSGLVVVILDGYDEMWDGKLALENAHLELRAVFPRIGWVLTSRPVHTYPSSFGQVVEMPRLTEEQYGAIRQRFMNSQMYRGDGDA